MLHTSLGGEGGEGMFYLCEGKECEAENEGREGKKYRVCGINAQEHWELAATQ